MTFEEKRRECSIFFERDNVRDHRAGTSDQPLQKHAQVRLRVHHIVIRRIGETFSILVPVSTTFYTLFSLFGS